MASPKQLSNEELKKLLELASSEPQTPEDSVELSEAERFAVSLGIRPGNTRVPCSVIWRHYKLWAEKPISKRAFYMQFSKVFTRIRWGHTRYYLLESDPFDLSREAMFAIREETRKEYNVRRKKEKDQAQ